MASAERRDVRIVIAETREALNDFEARLNEFSNALDDLEAETQRQRDDRRRWL